MATMDTPKGTQRVLWEFVIALTWGAKTKALPGQQQGHAEKEAPSAVL